MERLLNLPRSVPNITKFHKARLLLSDKHFGKFNGVARFIAFTFSSRISSKMIDDIL